TTRDALVGADDEACKYGAVRLPAARSRRGGHWSQPSSWSIPSDVIRFPTEARHGERAKEDRDTCALRRVVAAGRLAGHALLVASRVLRRDAQRRDPQDLGEGNTSV